MRKNSRMVMAAALAAMASGAAAAPAAPPAAPSVRQPSELEQAQTLLRNGRAEEALALLDPLLDAYEELLVKLHAAGAQWVQLDEPVLARHRTGEELDALRHAYRRLGTRLRRPAMLVSTYFGEIGDALPVLAASPAEAIGLDFVAGPGNSSALATISGMVLTRVPSRSKTTTGQRGEFTGHSLPGGRLGLHDRSPRRRPGVPPGVDAGLRRPAGPARVLPRAPARAGGRDLAHLRPRPHHRVRARREQEVGELVLNRNPEV